MAHSARAEDGATSDIGRMALARVLRQPPYLLPDDGVARAVGLLRHGGEVAPVMDSLGRLVGVLSIGDLLPLLEAAEDRSRLSRSIRPYVRPAPAVIGPDATLPDVRSLLLRTGETAAFVVDRRRRLLGAVCLADLLDPDPEMPRPTSVGGMATPWGVYLTTGTIHAGAGNRALLASGALLGLMMAGAYLAVGLALLGVQRGTGEGVYALWLGSQPARDPWRALEWLALQALALPVFALLMRLSPLTRYHAAEHQTVHAIERGEALELEALRRMPRVHPRCGTNLIAAAIVFTTVAQAATAVSGSLVDPVNAAALGAAAAFLTWRRVGAALQQYFTTRPAGDKHLASGLAAAEELLHRYVTELPVRPTLWRRLWCAGMPQMLVGVMLGLSAGTFVSRWVLSLVW